MDADRRCVYLAGGRQLDYDMISIDVGSEPDVALLSDLGERLVPVKPFPDFERAWVAIREQARSAPFRLSVVGAGAAGVEIALAARRTLGPEAQVDLIAGEKGVLHSHSRAARRMASDKRAIASFSPFSQ